MKRTIPILAATILSLGACSSGAPGGEPPARTGDPAPAGAEETRSPAIGGGTGTAASTRPAKIDPRDGGLDVVLGEWALTLEAGAIRPGRVTFVVLNRGTVPHGFEIEAEGRDSSGPGSGDGLKAETSVLQPGERTRLTLTLAAGIYKVECLVDGHDDLGMEGFLEVRRNAPLVRVEEAPAAGADVAIENFAFVPASLEVLVGDEITWANEDAAPHTVTAEDGSFDSGTIDAGRSFTLVASGNGPVAYMCLIHPDMTGTLLVG